MTRLTNMMALTHWTAIADFTAIVPAGGMAMLIDPTPIFDDVCNVYCDFRGKNDGADARVFRMDFVGEMLTDATADANKRIAQWLSERHDDLPDWLGNALFGACAYNDLFWGIIQVIISFQFCTNSFP